MKKAVVTSFVIIAFIAQGTFAQNQFSISQFYQLQAILNPGFTGVDDFLDIKIGYRQKWAGLANSPTTSFISANGSIGDRTSYNQSPLRISNPNQIAFIESKKSKLKSHGLGGYVASQEQGPFEQIKVMVNYAYHIPINTKLKISLGTSFGLSNVRVDTEKIAVWDKTNDPTYLSYLNGSGNYMRTIMTVGGVLYSKSSYFGVSYLPIIDISLSGNLEDLAPEQKLVIMSGTKFPLSHSLTLIPNILVEVNSISKTKIMGGVLIDINSMIKTGMAYSSTNDLSFSLNVNYKNDYGFGYAFEQNLNKESSIGNGTHELILSIHLFNRLNSPSRLW